jgi:hypothetical protein
MLHGPGQPGGLCLAQVNPAHAVRLAQILYFAIRKCGNLCEAGLAPFVWAA